MTRPRQTLCSMLLTLGFALVMLSPAYAEDPVRADDKAAPTRHAEPSDATKALFVDGTLAYHAGDFEAAITAWTKAYQAHPEPRILMLLADACDKAGDHDAAVRHYRLLLETTPDHPSAHRARTQLARLETP